MDIVSWACKYELTPPEFPQHFTHLSLSQYTQLISNCLVINISFLQKMDFKVSTIGNLFSKTHPNTYGYSISDLWNQYEWLWAAKQPLATLMIPQSNSVASRVQEFLFKPSYRWLTITLMFSESSYHIWFAYYHLRASSPGTLRWKMTYNNFTGKNFWDQVVCKSC